MKKLIALFAALITLSLFTINSCKKKELSKTNGSSEQNIQNELRTGGTCVSAGNQSIVSYTAGSTVLDSIWITDPNTGVSLYRYFRIFVPSTYDPNLCYPLVFMHHGKGQTSLRMVNKTTWADLGELHGFVVVFPQARTYTINGLTAARWNSINVELSATPGTDLHDDVFFFRELNDSIQQTLKIACDSVYACGFSNGSTFVKQRLRVDASDVIAAACGTGNIGDGSGVYLPVLGGSHRPFFEVCGSNDNPAISHCRTCCYPSMSALPIDQATIDITTCIVDPRDSLAAGMELDPSFKTVVQGSHSNGRRYTDYTFSTAIASPVILNSSPYKFRILEGLIHEVPSSNNGFQPDYYDDFKTFLWGYSL